MLIALLQIGGVPVPDCVTGTVLWCAWMLAVLLQWVTTMLSLIVSIASYTAMREALSDCAVMWKHGMKLIDVVALPSFAFQPVVLTKILVMWIYWNAMLEGRQVWVGAKASFEWIDDEDSKKDPKEKKRVPVDMDILRGKVGKPEEDEEPYMWYGYTCLFVVLPIVFSFLCWIVSLSFGFGFILFFPLAAFNALCYIITFGTLWLLERFTKHKKKAEHAKTEEEKKADEQLVVTSAGRMKRKDLRRMSSNHAFDEMVQSIDVWVHANDRADDPEAADHNRPWMSNETLTTAHRFAKNTDKYLKKIAR